MAKLLTIQGSNSPDELKRLAAFEELNELPTEVLSRLSELSKNPKALSFLKTSLQFGILKGLLNTI